MDFAQFNIRLRGEVNQYVCPGRNPSAAFLIWYLINFFRIDKEAAIDSVCDGSNDKGIDGIYVDDDEESIYLFQSKFSPNDGQSQGDTDLRNFLGAKDWFRDEQSIQRLSTSTANPELKSLLTRLSVREKIAMEYKVISHFITNKKFDRNGTEILGANQLVLCGFDCDDLFKRYTYLADVEIARSPATLVLASNTTKIEYNLSSDIVVRVYPILASELLKLDGIQDRTLFYKNVRYGLGNTRINRDIRETILDANQHDKFFLYHNGITIVCGSLEESANQLVLRDYYVINGCQSMLTFYENKSSITDNIYVLTKVIKLSSTSHLVHDITYFANNQNSISLKDLKSDDRVQKELKRQFEELFEKQVLYKIKKGEFEDDYSEVIELDFAAQLLVSFYLGMPQNSHLKAKLFGELYTKIFSRQISPAKIYLAYIVYNTVEDNADKLTNEQIRDYGLAKFFFTYLIGKILREDELGKEILSDPTDYVTDKIDVLKTALEKLWNLLIPDVNAYIEEYTKQNGNFFDYKNVFKNSDFVDSTCSRIKADNDRILVRHAEDSFKKIFETASVSGDRDRDLRNKQ